MTTRKRIFAFFSPKVQNYEFLCRLLQKHLPHRCKLLLSDWHFFFFLFQGLSGLPCTSTEARPGKADGEPFLGLRALCCMLQRMARVCWPCSLLHGMRPTARHAPCCTACICAQPVPMQRPGDLRTQITSLSAGKSPGANEIFMRQGIQGLGCKERQSFCREDELEGNILLESTLLESIACRRGWRMISLPWSEAPEPSCKVKHFLTCPHDAVLRSS